MGVIGLTGFDGCEAETGSLFHLYYPYRGIRRHTKVIVCTCIGLKGCVSSSELQLSQQEHRFSQLTPVTFVGLLFRACRKNVPLLRKWESTRHSPPHNKGNAQHMWSTSILFLSTHTQKNAHWLLSHWLLSQCARFK